MENDNTNHDLVETIVREVKSQGLFDLFRKECLADVDTKPAYQNLRSRVESSVASFLGAQEWKPDANRIQMREKLRKNIIGLSFLETGVERIVDQVVNPKISTVFLPQIEDIVYKYLGIEKPQVKPKVEPDVFMEQNGEIQMDLLPTDLLEAVSPDSDKKSHCSEENVKEEITEEEIVPELNESNDKIDDDESPPFEPLEGRPASPTDQKAGEDQSQDSHVSEISGLTSQDSVFSAKIPTEEVAKPQEEKEEQEEVMQPPRIDQMVEKSEVPERSVSDAVEAMDVGNQDSQLSQVSSNSRLSIVTNESDSKDDESLKMDLSEEAQMPEFDGNRPSSSSDQQQFTTFDINKDGIKFQQNFQPVFPQPPNEPPPPLPPTPPPPPAEEEKPEPAEPAEGGSDRKRKSKKSSRSSSSSRHHHKDKREKSTKSGDSGNSSTAADSDASPVLQIVETDTVDSSGDLSQAEKPKKSSSSHRRDDKKRSHSSSHRRHHKSSSKDKKSRKEDDHSSQREKHPEKRRSADRDSNDGSSGPKPSSTPPSGSEAGGSTSTAVNQSNAGESSSTSSNTTTNAPISTAAALTSSISSSPADSASEKVTLATKPIIVDQILTANSEINLQLIVNHSSNDPTLAKIEELAKKSLAKKKPKIASNFKEAMRLMKMRKKIDHESKKNMEKAMVLAKNYINSQAEKDPSVSEHLTQGIELEFACSQSGSGPIISSPVKGEAHPNLTDILPARQSPAKEGKEEEEVTTSSKEGKQEAGDSEPEDDLLHFPDPRSKIDESITEKWWNDQKKSPKVKKTPKNGLLQKNIVIRSKRSLDSEHPSADGPDEKCPKFGDLNGNEDIVSTEEQKKITRIKTPSTQQQRYSSDDLYKPRPLIHGQRTRRRGFEPSAGADEGGTA